MEIHNDSYLLLGFEYETYKDITKTLIDGDTERHKVWNECNSVDTLIKISTGKPYYKSKTLTYSEIAEIVKTNNVIIDNYTFEDIFENVSITYNRDYKLKELGI
jgi:hypothetical protein